MFSFSLVFFTNSVCVVVGGDERDNNSFPQFGSCESVYMYRLQMFDFFQRIYLELTGRHGVVYVLVHTPTDPHKVKMTVQVVTLVNHRFSTLLSI